MGKKGICIRGHLGNKQLNLYKDGTYELLEKNKELDKELLIELNTENLGEIIGDSVIIFNDEEINRYPLLFIDINNTFELYISEGRKIMFDDSSQLKEFIAENDLKLRVINSEL